MFIKDDIEDVNCPWCGGLDNRKWCEDEAPFLTVQCLECGVVYVKHRLNEHARIQYYKNYNSEKHQEAVKSSLREKMYKIENEFVTSFVKEGNILDVGCGGGSFWTLLLILNTTNMVSSMEKMVSMLQAKNTQKKY